MAEFQEVEKDGREYLSLSNVLLSNPKVTDRIYYFEFFENGRNYEYRVVPFAPDTLQKYMESWHTLKTTIKRQNPKRDIPRAALFATLAPYKKQEQIRILAPHEKDPNERLVEAAQKLDRISDTLEKKGYLKEAYDLDVTANTIESGHLASNTHD